MLDGLCRAHSIIFNLQQLYTFKPLCNCWQKIQPCPQPTLNSSVRALAEAANAKHSRRRMPILDEAIVGSAEAISARALVLDLGSSMDGF